MIIRLLLTSGFLALLLSGPARAQSSSFDLVGPALRLSVTRGNATLPIAQVPQLAAGDRLHLSTDLPADQLRKSLVVVAFLRGAASPPPKSWLVRVKPDKRRPGATTLIVPDGAQQALVLVAPDVGGGFASLVSTVRGRPGIFVRASQNLYQASLDRARLEAFLTQVQASEQSGERLDSTWAVLARNLAIRWDADCLQRLPSLRGACLTQNREALILHDGRNTTLAETLTGAPADLAYRVSAIPQGGSGYYNPYIGLVRDVARLLGGFRTAQYQYVPALTLGRGDTLTLMLNTAPSFRKPHSAIVVPLPPIEAGEPPTIRAIAPDDITCAARPGALLPIEGAPLLYATGFARNLVVRFATGAGKVTELPVTADARKGGLVLPAAVAGGDVSDPVVEATLHGHWGFGLFAGPSFRLQAVQPNSWRAAEGTAPVIGRANEIRLLGGAASCVDSVSLETVAGSARPLAWKAAGPRSLTLTLPLDKARVGSAALHVVQQGQPEALRIPLKLLDEASQIDGFALHAGDRSGALKGTRLDQVAAVKIQGTSFAPADLTRVGSVDRLAMTTATPEDVVRYKSGQRIVAKVELKDGRVLSVPVIVANPRPRVALINRTVEPGPETSLVTLSVGNDAVPQGATITFSLQAKDETRFSGREALEIATADGLSTAIVKIGDGLIVVDPQTLVARIAISEALGKAAFGPLKYRLVAGGVASDWQLLSTLVRLPSITGITCTDVPSSCTLAGSDLFLVDSVASDAAFSDAVQVPRGYTGVRISIPGKRSGDVFIRLRDAPLVFVRSKVRG